MSPDMKTADIKTVDTKGIGKKKSRLSEVWRQLKKNKFAMVGMVVIILLIRRRRRKKVDANHSSD